MNFKRLNLWLAWLAIFLLVVTVAYAALVTPTTVHTQYPSQGKPVKGVVTLRSASALTTGYVSTNVAVFRGFDAVRLFFNLTQGSLTSFEYRVWSSPDSVTWYQEANETVGSTEIIDSSHYYKHTLGAGDVYYKDIPMFGVYFKLDVKGTGTVTGSSCAITAMGIER